ncbi:MAG: tRNA 2-selenouridine(34) synthase MnmH [Planctomycetota bacterium]
MREFLRADDRSPIFDVRSPGEHEHGHISGALSLPIFDDQERARVGTAFKQQSPEDAFEIGLEVTGPKLASFVRTARPLAVDNRVRVHCWRGGLRSNAMAWLFRQAGIEVDLLHGGYKAYRTEVLRSLREDRQFLVLGGMTGSGKTDAILALKSNGAQAIDLEGLAGHKGSAFGNLALTPQPTSEQFSNDVHHELARLGDEAPVWLEDESSSIGRVQVPPELVERIRNAPIVLLERTDDDRVARLCVDYGDADHVRLKDAFDRIRKKLGGQNVQAAHAAIDEDDLATATRIALVYYDKYYQRDLERRARPVRGTVQGSGLDQAELARALRAHEPAHAV